MKASSLTHKPAIMKMAINMPIMPHLIPNRLETVNDDGCRILAILAFGVTGMASTGKSVFFGELAMLRLVKVDTSVSAKPVNNKKGFGTWR